jgi:hypothetical protein
VEVPKLNHKNIRVPTPAWSNSFLEQNRFLIDIGFHLLLLAIAISPFVVLYVKRKSPSGWLDLAFLLIAMLGLPFASSYAESILPSHQLVFVRGYAGLCFVVLAITFVMVSWRFKASTKGTYALRVLSTLFLLGLLIGLLLPSVPTAREAARRMACGNNIKTLGLELLQADGKSWDLKEPPPHNGPVLEGGPDVSWRVKILPYIEQANLFKEYDPKKEWDDDLNWRIAQQKIPVFSCPSEPDLMNPEGGRFTSYVMLQNTNRSPGNPKLVYDKDRKKTDSNRILLIESCSANVFWTEPRDADVDWLGWSLQPKTRIERKEPWRSRNVGASSHDNFIHVVLGDGSIKALPKSIDDRVFRKILLGEFKDDTDFP